MTTYRVTEQADLDMLEIWQYTAVHWSVEQAERMNQRFHQRFESLAEQPFQGHSRPELGPDYRSVPLESFLIIYQPADYGVLILHVVHGRRRLESLIQLRGNDP